MDLTVNKISFRASVNGKQLSITKKNNNYDIRIQKGYKLTDKEEKFIKEFLKKVDVSLFV